MLSALFAARTFERCKDAGKIVELRAGEILLLRAEDYARLAHIQAQIMPQNPLRAAIGSFCDEL